MVMFNLITAATTSSTPLGLTVLQGQRPHRTDHGASQLDPKSVAFAGKDAEEFPIGKVGAVDMEHPLLMPMMDVEDEHQMATLIYRNEDIFARLAARGNISRINRYHIANIFGITQVTPHRKCLLLIVRAPSPVAGYPKVQKAAVFDIIIYNVESGPIVAGAEFIAITNDGLNSFPNLALNYDITNTSHSTNFLRAIGMLSLTYSINQNRPLHRSELLLKRGLLRSTADELELLSGIGPADPTRR
ncbi:hypothetical protein DXG01_003205 [Tephrocybe rancida]|nr:hypothetical protein DXG01_003205 [Tephrocybe rancida]